MASDERTPGQRLRDIRVGRGWTQTKLSVRARCAVGTVGFAERDERQPQTLVQERIARARGVDRREIWRSRRRGRPADGQQPAGIPAQAKLPGGGLYPTPVPEAAMVYSLWESTFETVGDALVRRKIRELLSELCPAVAEDAQGRIDLGDGRFWAVGIFDPATSDDAFPCRPPLHRDPEEPSSDTVDPDVHRASGTCDGSGERAGPAFPEPERRSGQTETQPDHP